METKDNKVDALEKDEIIPEIQVMEEAGTLTRKQSRIRKYIEKQKAKVLSRTLDNDIKYRGPLSVMGLRGLAWAFIVFGALGIMINFGGKFDKGLAELNWLTILLDNLSSFAIPAFLLAKFGTIFQNKDGYKHMLIQYGFLVILIAFAFYFVYLRYAVVGFMTVLDIGFGDAFDQLNQSFSTLLGRKITFNVFVDMFLMAAYITFRLYQNPSWSKKQTVLFRLGTILPIAYVSIAFVFKILHIIGEINIHTMFLPLLPTNSPLMMLSFAAITEYIKKREKLYYKIGGTKEGYAEYSKTKANSWYFAKSTSFVFLIFGLIEFIIVVILMILFVIEYGEEDGALLTMALVFESGIGENVSMVLFIPFILLFSFNREVKSSVWNFVIPIASIAIIIFLGFEFGFQMLTDWLRRAYSSLKEGISIVMRL